MFAVKVSLTLGKRMKGVGGLVECSADERDSDRTPLDCYREVEDFKTQTRRLERQFVVRTVGRDFPRGN